MYVCVCEIIKRNSLTAVTRGNLVTSGYRFRVTRLLMVTRPKLTWLLVWFCRHPSDNPFYSNIDSMPDIRPRRKSIPLVSELVSRLVIPGNTIYSYMDNQYTYTYIARILRILFYPQLLKIFLKIFDGNSSKLS